MPRAKPITVVKEFVQVTYNPYTLIMRINGLPKTYNAMGRSHWAVKAKEVKYWHEQIAYRVMGKTPKNPLSKAMVKLIRCSSRAPDADGIVSSFKAPLDGLTRAGIIADDDMSVIGFPEYEWRKGKAKTGYIEIYVTDVLDS